MQKRSHILACRWVWLAISIGITVGFSLPGQAPYDKAALVKIIDRHVRTRAARLGIPGWAFGLVIDGDVVLRRTVGTRSTRHDAKVNSATRFQIGSLAKSFSAIVTAKFLLHNKLRLDDPIKKYLPERCVGARCEHITIRNLLNHTTGIVADATNASIEMGESYESTLSHAWSAPRQCAPGTCFHYNNAIYELMREILEKVGSRPYREILKSEILTPLALTGTSASFSELKRSGNYVFPHLFQSPHFVETEHSTIYYAYPGAAGLNSDLEDMLKFVSAELGNAPKVISTEELELLHRSTIEAPDVYAWFDNEQARKDVKSSYALGHRVLQYPDLQVVFHTGWVKGCKTVASLFPDQKLGLVLLQNTDSEFGFQVLEDVIALLRRKT